MKSRGLGDRRSRRVRPARDVAGVRVELRAFDGVELTSEREQLACARRERFGQRRPSGRDAPAAPTSPTMRAGAPRPRPPGRRRWRRRRTRRCGNESRGHDTPARRGESITQARWIVVCVRGRIRDRRRRGTRRAVRGICCIRRSARLAAGFMHDSVSSNGTPSSTPRRMTSALLRPA